MGIRFARWNISVNNWPGAVYGPVCTVLWEGALESSLSRLGMLLKVYDLYRLHCIPIMLVYTLSIMWQILHRGKTLPR